MRIKRVSLNKKHPDSFGFCIEMFWAYWFCSTPARSNVISLYIFTFPNFFMYSISCAFSSFSPCTDRILNLASKHFIIVWIIWAKFFVPVMDSKCSLKTKIQDNTYDGYNQAINGRMAEFFNGIGSIIMIFCESIIIWQTAQHCIITDWWSRHYHTGWERVR